MNREKTTATLLIAIFMISASTISLVMAKGPTNAGGKHDFAPSDPHDEWRSEHYIGLDYGAGWTPTLTKDGTFIAPIGSEEYPATLLAKGHYFSEWWEPFSEKDWVYYKFWLNDPVLITFSDTSTYTATQFIVITCELAKAEYTLQGYK